MCAPAADLVAVPDPGSKSRIIRPQRRILQPSGQSNTLQVLENDNSRIKQEQLDHGKFYTKKGSTVSKKSKYEISSNYLSSQLHNEKR
jgi:hypothetical protein